MFGWTVSLNVFGFDKNLAMAEGFTFVEILVAMTVVGIVSIGMLVMTRVSTEYAVEFKLYDHATNIELGVLEALFDPENYDDHVGALKGKKTPVGLQLLNDGKLMGEIGRPIFFNDEGDVCSGGTFSSCRYAVEADIRCTGQGCLAAYRVSIRSESGISSRQMGAPGIFGSNFTSSDYFIPVHYLESELEKGISRCTTGPAIGINRDSGELICASVGNLTCDSGELPLGLDIVDTVIQMDCQPLGTFSCPNHWVVNSIDMGTLFPGQDPSGSCVFVTADQGPWTVPWPTNDLNVDIRVCPEPYYTANSDTSCTPIVTNVQTVDEVTCDASGNCVTTTIQPNIGSAEYSIHDETYARCVYTKPASQPAGTDFDVVGLSWSGKCQLKPEYQGVK